jgi:disulfide bond formation protein DsbB
MSPLVESLNFYLALSGVASFLFAVILVVDIHRERALQKYIERFGLYMTFSIALGSSVVALMYSEIFGFVPCGLCWLERIFLFPQGIILLGALYFKDKLVARYGIILSTIGFTIALYHHYLQMGGTQFIKCPAAGAVDCAKRIMFEFDFMTFPLLAAAGFALLGALYYYILKSR